ncbi:MAG: DNA recombination protein RmuC [Verrucomicrobia bacterium]|nr:DNA recombination protein RmuC [Verrucomicrobiota bacterium]MDE3099246.1 DNA recombination protein RmuC [Verrucomicrobiota bacterium]
MNLPLGIQWLIAALAGGTIGFIIGWIKGRSRPSPGDARLEIELRRQIEESRSETANLRARISEAGNARAAAEASQAAAQNLVAEQKLSHEKAVADLREAFKALSADALRQSAPEFLRLAEQSFGKFQESAKGDLAQRQEAIKTLVEPLKQQLESYKTGLQQSVAAQSQALGEVKKQLEMLSQSSQALASETEKFRSVLKSNQARGKWGEETLRRVVEAAGMSAHCDFIEQDASGENRPDLIVRLPGERVIIVDAKAPDFDFLNALETADADRRREALQTHARKLKDTIRALAERDYPRQYPNALDYAVLFVPAESLFSAALEGDRDLIVWAAERQILLATPASLIALLRSVAVSWQQHKQTENAQKIAAAARELFSRVCVFTEHFGKIGEGLARANDAFNKATGSYESRVRPAGEKLTQLGGTAQEKELADVQPVETAPRLPSSTLKDLV